MRPTPRLAVLALAALTSLVFASAAQAGPNRHFLEMYKVEKQVDLASTVNGSGAYTGPQSVTANVACKFGDNAVDGMWRIDHVDQANPQTGVSGDERDVFVQEAYALPSPANGTYRFTFTSGAAHLGRAQIKVWTVCLGASTTVVAGHSHAVQVNQSGDSGSNLYGPGPTGPFTYPGVNPPCTTNQIAVAPGFRFASGSGRQYVSYPLTSALRSWQWAFVVDTPADIHVYIKCLNTEVFVGGTGHSHKVNDKWLPNFNGSLRHLALGASSQSISCGAFGSGAYDEYKGLVGGFWIDDPLHVWFLGMDPRIKSRVFRFFNAGGGLDSVRLGLLCVEDRVGDPI